MIRRYSYILIPLLMWGCKKDQDISSFDTSKSYAYFALENPDRSSNRKQLYIDSLDYFFAYEKDDVTEKKLAIPVNVMGKAQETDRRYAYTIDEAETTIDRSLLRFSEPIIRAGKVQDTLFITVQRGSVLQKANYSLVLKMEENENFELGHNYNTKMKIAITDQLLEPEWWKRWVRVFGQYHREVYRIWMDIYYEGADPNDTGNEAKPFYYWNNMPYSPNPSWYKPTYFYIDQLKKYLENNAVYPGGDTSQPRLYLP